MSVYKRRLPSLHGPLTPLWSRVLVLPRYALAEVWSVQDHRSASSCCASCPSSLSPDRHLLSPTIPLARPDLRGRAARRLPSMADFFLASCEVQCWLAFCPHRMDRARPGHIRPRRQRPAAYLSAVPSRASNTSSAKYGARHPRSRWSPGFRCLLLFSYQAMLAEAWTGSATAHRLAASSSGSLDLDCPAHPARPRALVLGQMADRGHRRSSSPSSLCRRASAACDRRALRTRWGFLLNVGYLINACGATCWASRPTPRLGISVLGDCHPGSLALIVAAVLSPALCS